MKLVTVCLGLLLATPAVARTPGDEEVLAPFLACTSPSAFIELQRGVDMARLVEELDDWSAVRLGSLGPLRSGADVLNRKRASFLVTVTREYGVARAELFALFVVHSAFTDDLHQVLVILAEDKHLNETLGRMGAVRAALQRRGLNLSGYVDRPERPGDVARGLADATHEALSTSELRRGALSMKYDAQRAQLPPPYQRALDEVERAVLVGLYAGGKGFRALSGGTEATGIGWGRVRRLQVPELGIRGCRKWRSGSGKAGGEKASTHGGSVRC